jgi:hypothetical protein
MLNHEDKELLMKPLNEILHGEKGHIPHLFTQFPQFPLDSEGLILLGIQEKAHSIIRALEAGRLEEKCSRVLLKSLCLKGSV